MTNQQRQLIRDIFEEALSISPDKWSCLLEQRAGHDAIVKSEVEVLLAARKLPPENETRSMACNAEPSQRPARPASPEGRFLPGDMFAGRYRIVSLLGRGGMGEVYRAHDLKLEEAIALKLLPSANLDANRLERFRNEVRTARPVTHPNVCRVFDIGESQSAVYLTMEYIDGRQLGSNPTQGV